MSPVHRLPSLELAPVDRGDWNMEVKLSTAARAPNQERT